MGNPDKAPPSIEVDKPVRMRRIFRVFEAGNAETLERVLNDSCAGWEIMEILSSNNHGTSPYLVVCHTSTFGVGGFGSAIRENQDGEDEKASPATTRRPVGGQKDLVPEKQGRRKAPGSRTRKKDL